MSPKRVYFILVGIIVLLAGVVAGGTFYGNVMLQKESDKLVELKLEDQLLEEQQIALVQANKDIEQYAELEDIAKAVVPQDKDQAKAVREIVKIAADAGVNISSLSFPASNLGQTAPVVTPQTTEGSDTATPTTPAAPPVTQVKPVSGIAGVYELEITVQTSSQVSFNQLISFLERLEQNRRTAQVSSLTITPDTTERDQLTFNLTLKVYIKP